MFQKFCSVLFIVTLFYNVHWTESQDINTLFSKMMKDFKTKDTRYYTILNGVPVKVSEDGPIDNNEIYKRIASVLPAGTGPAFQQIMENDKMPEIPANFQNNNNQWNPVSPIQIQDPSSPVAPTPSKSWFSGWFGGRSIRDGNMKDLEESDIITIDDLPHVSGGTNRKSFDESQPFDIKVQSSMKF